MSSHTELAEENKNPVTYFGVTDFRGKEERFGIKADDRTRHMYVIGKTGMGKSTMLENLAIQDIQNGNGLCFVDPHGTTAEKLLKYVPEHRVNDVIYFAPFDTKYPMSLNILEHVEEDKRHLVSSGLMDTFKKVFGEDVFSGRMVYLLNNAVLSLLENEGESLLGINRIFADKDYRKKIVANVKDPAVLSFWNDEFAKYEDKYVKEASAAIQNKIGQFIMTPMIRNIVGQAHSSFDLREIMDNKKILICNFSIGLTGSENVNLIGSLLITKIYLAAMSRANLSYDKLQQAAPFYFYVDEFQNFVNDSFAQILSQARKYNLGLTIAHQYVEQLTDNVKAAVFGNVGSMISFRVGATDAEQLEKEFAPKFTADDIVNLGARQIYLRLSIDGVGSQPFSARTMPPIADDNIDYVPAMVASSRAQYAKEKSVVEKEVADWYQPVVKRDILSNKPSSLEERFSFKKDDSFKKENNFKKEVFVDTRLVVEPRPEYKKAEYTLKLKKDIDSEKEIEKTKEKLETKIESKTETRVIESEKVLEYLKPEEKKIEYKKPEITNLETKKENNFIKKEGNSFEERRDLKPKPNLALRNALSSAMNINIKTEDNSQKEIHTTLKSENKPEYKSEYKKEIPEVKKIQNESMRNMGVRKEDLEKILNSED